MGSTQNRSMIKLSLSHSRSLVLETHCVGAVLLVGRWGQFRGQNPLPLWQAITSGHVFMDISSLF